MTQRDTCIFYRSIYEAIKDLPPATKLEVYDSVFAFLLDFKEPELQGLSKTIFTLIEPVLRNANKNFVNGNKPKGKRTKSQKEAKDKPTESETEAYKYKDKYKDNYEDKDEDKELKNDSTESKPTFDFESLESNYQFKKHNEVDLLIIFNDQQVNKAFQDYIKHRITIKKYATKNAILILQAKLRKECGSDKAKAIELLQEPVMNNWIGIVWDRKNKAPNKPEPTQFNRSSANHYV
jgi:hypothetical protein